MKNTHINIHAHTLIFYYVHLLKHIEKLANILKKSIWRVII